MNKRLLNLFLALVMIVCVLPFAASAAECEHTYSLLWVLREPTCKEIGYGAYGCYQCQQYEFRNIPATHSIAVLPAIEATCTTPGKTEGQVCTACGTILKAQKTIPGGHDFSVEVGAIVEATCTTDGTFRYQCANCDATKDVTIKAGHVPVEIPAIPTATCTKSAKTAGEKCARCNVVLVPQKITQKYLGHDPQRVGAVKEATCTEDGVDQYACSRCGKKSTKEVAALKHDYSVNEGYKKGYEATCEKTGLFVLACSRCDSKTTQLAPVVEHKAIANPGVEPTCTEAGLTAGTKCEYCGISMEHRTPIEALGHDFVETVTKEATCTEDGQKKYTCSRCNGSYTEAIPALKHEFTVNKGYKEGFEPTCQKTGLYLIGCTRCDALTTQTAPVVDHKAIANPGVEPTCKEAGLTAGTKCEYCGTSMEHRTPIEALGHDFVATVIKEATCTEDGQKKLTCSRCDAWYSEAIPALKHDYSKNLGYKEDCESTCVENGLFVLACSRCDSKTTQTAPLVDCEPELWPGREATCKETGRTDGEKCKHCGKVLTNREEIPALGHAFETEIKDATCTEAGQKKHTCTRCGAWYVEEIPALKHDFTVNKGYKDGKAPTCQEEGLVILGCSRCDAETAQTAPVVECEPEVWPGYAPTCEAEGREDGAKCKMCKKTLIKRKRIDALGHDYSINKGYREGDEPTCQETGISVLECSRCGHQTAQTAPVVACEVEVWAGYAPTCTETGRTDGERCKFCKDVKKNREVIPALDHDFSVEFKVVKEATCTKAGSTVFKCSRCEGYCELTVDALGHNNVELERWEPTCTKAGISETKCDRCSLHAIQKVDALGHTEVTVEGVAATCTATGLSDGIKCSTCEAILKAREELPMVDHSWKTVPAKDATCTEDGYTEHKQCEVCQAIEGKEDIKAAHQYVNSKCTVCGIGDPTCKHQNAVMKHTASTCTEAGSQSFKCPDCNYEKVETLPLAEHKTAVQSTPATCTAKGETRKVCTVCKRVVERIEIPMTSHTYANGKCTACGASDPNYTAPTTPSTPTEPEVTGCKHLSTSTYTHPATCLTDGYKVVTCSQCDAVISREILPAAGHTEKVTIQRATCTRNGVKNVKCSVCDEFISHEVLPAFGHDYDNGICDTCGSADPDRYTADFQDVFLLDKEAKG